MSNESNMSNSTSLLNLSASFLYRIETLIMKSICTVISFLLLTSISFSKEEYRIAAPFVFEKSEPAPELAKNIGIYQFKFNGLLEEDLSASIILSCDQGENQTFQLKNGILEYQAKKGYHQFVIYINESYYELYSHNLQLNEKERFIYSVRLTETNGLIEMVDKPVIYLYPETSQEFHVQVAPKGEMAFTYPKYKDGWSGVMHPDGNLEVDGASYNYLFWESQQALSALNPKTTAGFVVRKNEVLDFLEEKLDEVGFTSKERADFITYWGPRMQQLDQVFVTFHQDQECDQFADLNIVPKPDNIHRFYLSWGAYDGNEIPKAQKLIPFQRDGFTVVEWGGSEVPTVTYSLTL